MPLRRAILLAVLAALAGTAALAAARTPIAPRGAAERLVAPPQRAVTLPFTPSWMPGGDPQTVTYVNLDTRRTLARYALADAPSGAISVQIETQPAPGETAPSAPVNVRPSAPARPVQGHDGHVGGPGTYEVAPMPVRGHPGQHVSTSHEGRKVRTCELSWSETSDLWFRVTTVEKIVPEAPAACVLAHQIADGLRVAPAPLVRPWRLGLVPRGYTLLSSGNQRETWCPADSDHRVESRCLVVQAPAERVAAGIGVTVAGHAAHLRRDEHQVLLVIPGEIEIVAPTPAADPNAAALSDEDVLALAASHF